MNLLAYTPIEQLGNYGRYLYGLYFMVSLITTIAYGDIIGKNAFEEVLRYLFRHMCPYLWSCPQSASHLFLNSLWILCDMTVLDFMTLCTSVFI